MSDTNEGGEATRYRNPTINLFKGVLGGLFLLWIGASFLYWSERHINLGDIARNAIHIDSNNPTPGVPDGTLVSMTGVVTSEEEIDDVYLTPRNYVAWNRVVEIYAWTEECKSENGTLTSCSSLKKWSTGRGVKNPKTSRNSNLLGGGMGISSKTKIGQFTFDAFKVGLYGEHDEFVKLPLNEKSVDVEKGNAGFEGSGFLPANEKGVLTGNFILFRNNPSSTSDQPEIGDVRLSYEVIEPGFTATLFGKVGGSSIEPHEPCIGDRCGRLYRLFSGTREEALTEMNNEHYSNLWIVRILSFIFMLPVIILIGTWYARKATPQTPSSAAPR